MIQWKASPGKKISLDLFPSSAYVSTIKFTVYFMSKAILLVHAGVSLSAYSLSDGGVFTADTLFRKNSHNMD